MKEQIITVLDRASEDQTVISLHQGIFRIVIQRKDGL